MFSVARMMQLSPRTSPPTCTTHAHPQVKIFKNKGGATEVWVQSELRIGESDLNVNYKRMEALLGHLGANLK